jgi:chorismate synthase
MQKYGFSDARDILERASARETAARVAAGAIAKKLVSSIGIEILSHVISIGSVGLDRDLGDLSIKPKIEDLKAIDASQVRCFDADLEKSMIAEIKAAAKAGDSLGGSVEVIAYGVPVGLGSHVHYDRKLDGLLAQAFMSIQAVKAVEIGMGASLGYMRGSAAHDEIHWKAKTKAYERPTVRAGGIEGGISTGGPITAIVTMKPLATLNRPSIKTVDTVTKESKFSFKERTDVVAVPALGVVSETMMAVVLAATATEKFGGDSLHEFVTNFKNYKKNLNSAPSSVDAIFGKIQK